MEYCVIIEMRGKQTDESTRVEKRDGKMADLYKIKKNNKDRTQRSHCWKTKSSPNNEYFPFTYICTAKMLNRCFKLKPKHGCVRLLCSFMVDLWV